MTGTKPCPFCAEEIAAESTRCKHCDSMLITSTRRGQLSSVAESEAAKNKAELDRKLWLVVKVLSVIFFILLIGFLGSLAGWWGFLWQAE
jgi:hypothetical protein